VARDGIEPPKWLGGEVLVHRLPADAEFTGQDSFLLGLGAEPEVGGLLGSEGWFAALVDTIPLRDCDATV
jgi:hypothetical protein